MNSESPAEITVPISIGPDEIQPPVAISYRLDCAEALEMWAPDSPVLERKEVKQWLKEAMATRNQL
jgi:hypothetical protein